MMKSEIEINMFLLEQELKRGDSDVLDWSIDKIKEIIISHGGHIR